MHNAENNRKMELRVRVKKWAAIVINHYFGNSMRCARGNCHLRPFFNVAQSISLAKINLPPEATPKQIEEAYELLPPNTQIVVWVDPSTYQNTVRTQAWSIVEDALANLFEEYARMRLVSFAEGFAANNGNLRAGVMAFLMAHHIDEDALSLLTAYEIVMRHNRHTVQGKPQTKTKMPLQTQHKMMRQNQV